MVGAQRFSVSTVFVQVGGRQERAQISKVKLPITGDNLYKRSLTGSHAFH